MEDEGRHQRAKDGFGGHQDGGSGLGGPLLSYGLEQESYARGQKAKVDSRQD